MAKKDVKTKVTPPKNKSYKTEETSFFSENIQRRRRELGITQGEFALRLGIWQKQVSELENGRFVESPQRVVDIARALETTPDYLFGFREEP